VTLPDLIANYLESGLIITEDYEGKEIIGDKRINFMPLWLWLMFHDNEIIQLT